MTVFVDLSAREHFKVMQDCSLLHQVLVRNVIHVTVKFPANSNLRGHRIKLHHQLSHLARHEFAFPVVIVEPWTKW